jgi:DNA-3-methyladenine glycosylase
MAKLESYLFKKFTLLIMMNKEFFKCSTEEVAEKLLGMNLVHESPQGKTVGRIVEVEAYLHDDPASHSFRGKTKRNEAMFENAGIAYVYFIYGNYFCFNIVTNKTGVGEAVLIRALEPIEGKKLMRKRRNKSDDKKLCNGPAKLVQAMGITREHNKANLLFGKLRLEENPKKDFSVVRKKRIGISVGKSKLLRFYIKRNEFVSRLK